jgi:hypothetical protein
MKFSEYLNYLKDKKKCNSITELYTTLGGQESLEMSLRNFQVISSGHQQPTIQMLFNIVKHIDKQEYKRALISFFNSFVDEKEADELKSFLTFINNFLPAPNEIEKAVWLPSNREEYSQKQLDFLAENQDAMKVHIATTLYGKIEKDQLSKNQQLLVDDLEKLNLVKIKKNHIIPSNVSWRLPKYDSSSPAAVRRGNKLTASILEQYLLHEGGESQEFSLIVQTIKKDQLDTVKEEFQRLSFWIKSLTVDSEESQDTVPIISILFTRNLDKKDFK